MVVDMLVRLINTLSVDGMTSRDHGRLSTAECDRTRETSSASPNDLRIGKGLSTVAGGERRSHGQALHPQHEDARSEARCRAIGTPQGSCGLVPEI